MLVRRGTRECYTSLKWVTHPCTGKLTGREDDLSKPLLRSIHCSTAVGTRSKELQGSEWTGPAVVSISQTFLGKTW
ncbi:hypothetical protein PISMIDRAFT_674036 [Pisolithus microcarpus 441]|uniref:Uncharacterized protein n=1 Tax=Pisolithus microcarpus 441 TaxID=765257 RepID=A0A0C9YTN0_9AGAM|nr:hypothetical protein PISMIDRAFT_674036 [Pisolithus microcarpus 441]